VTEMVMGLAGRGEAGRRLAVGLVVAFLPAAVAGFLAEERIEEYLFGPWPVIGAWAVGGVFLLWVAPRIRQREGRPIEEVTWRIALVIGLAQCAALWPGVSRSLATILGAIAAGLSLTAAVEFSFLLGLVTLGAATAYKALDSGAAMVEAYGAAELAVGFGVACLSAVIAVRWMVAWLGKRGLGIFGWWRIGAAAAVAAMLLAGVL
jgi:undecaprenyl-diphosphatase